MTDFLQRMVVIDVETTGLHPFYDRIIEIGIAVFEGTRWTHRADFFVNPEGRVLRQEIVDITGITYEQVADAPPFCVAFNKIAPWLYGATPVAFNASFDRRFLQFAVQQTWPRHAFGVELPPCLTLDVRWVDANALARGLVDLPGGKYKLGRVAEHLGFDVREAHRADMDALLAGAILLKLIKDNPQHDWRYAATIARARAVDAAYARQKFFWSKPDFANDPNAAWLGKDKPVQVYECDVCHQMNPGQYGKKGWTEPVNWSYYAALGVRRLVCGPACEAILSWHSDGWMLPLESQP